MSNHAIKVKVESELQPTKTFTGNSSFDDAMAYAITGDNMECTHPNGDISCSVRGPDHGYASGVAAICWVTEGKGMDVPPTGKDIRDELLSMEDDRDKFIGAINEISRQLAWHLERECE